MYWFDLLCKSMDWFLYERGPLHERVKAGVLVSNKRGRDIRLNIVLQDINKISTRYIKKIRNLTQKTKKVFDTYIQVTIIGIGMAARSFQELWG